MQNAMTVLLGGPVAGVFNFYTNFKTLDEHDNAQKVLTLGGSILGVLFLIVPFLPAQISGMGITAACVVLVYIYTGNMHLKKREIFDSDDFEAQPNWLVLFIGAASLLFSFTVGTFVLFLYKILGLI